MCLDQPTSWLSWCTAKTSHLALQQRHLSSCQDSSFHMEICLSANSTFSTFQKTKTKKKRGENVEMNAGIWSESDQLETTWCSHEGTFSFWHCFYSPQCSEPTVSHFRLLAHISFSAGIYTFSDSTSPWGKTGHKRNQKGDSLCVLKNPRRFSCFLPIRLTPSCLFWLLTSALRM